MSIVTGVSVCLSDSDRRVRVRESDTDRRVRVFG